MPVRSKDQKSDPVVGRILKTLEVYAASHGRAAVEAYRQNSVAVRVRIIDTDFGKLDQVEREAVVWKLLDQLPSDVLAEISLLLLLTPAEAKRSIVEHQVRTARGIECLRQRQGAM